MKKSKKIITNLLGVFLKKFFLNSLYHYFVFFRTRKKFKKNINNNKVYLKFSKKISDINNFEYKITSQNNEDGIIEYIFKKIKNKKKFIEIGFSFYEFNTLNLIRKGWSGKLIDYNQDESIALNNNLKYFYPKSKVKIINSKVTKDNINELLEYDIAKKEVDFFSLDIDGNDYWVLQNLDISNFKVICCEYNHWLGKDKKITIKYSENFKFKDDGIWGASLLAYTELLKKKNFSLIAVESSGTNAFYINNNINVKFKILCPKKNFISVGRFYSEKRKKEIYNNIQKNLYRFIEV